MNFFNRFGQILFNLAYTFAACHEKSIVPVYFKVSVDQLFDNLESRKRTCCFRKTSGKSPKFWIQKIICTNLASLVACVQTPLPSGKIGGGGGLYTGYSLKTVFFPKIVDFSLSKKN